MNKDNCQFLPEDVSTGQNELFEDVTMMGVFHILWHFID